MIRRVYVCVCACACVCMRVCEYACVFVGVVSPFSATICVFVPLDPREQPKTDYLGVSGKAKQCKLCEGRPQAKTGNGSVVWSSFRRDVEVDVDIGGERSEVEGGKVR